VGVGFFIDTTTKAKTLFLTACDAANSAHHAVVLQPKMQDYDQNVVYAPTHAQQHIAQFVQETTPRRY